MPSDALPTYWITRYKADKARPNGDNDPGSVCTSGHRPTTPGQWPWCSTPRTSHVSPQLHVKFDDFFETVQKKFTNLDAPEPEWKYLSGFAIQKGQPKPRANGPLGDLLAPRGGPTTAHPPALPTADLTTQRQQPLTHQDNDDVVTNVDDSPTLASPAPPPQQAPTQAPQNSAVQQTCSGRVVTNIPRYDQSMMQRSQGLVAWEVFICQDEREDMPTAATQYAPSNKLWKTPLLSRPHVTQTSPTGIKQ